jgi:hypothetical protein
MISNRVTGSYHVFQFWVRESGKSSWATWRWTAAGLAAGQQRENRPGQAGVGCAGEKKKEIKRAAGLRGELSPSMIGGLEMFYCFLDLIQIQTNLNSNEI